MQQTEIKTTVRCFITTNFYVADSTRLGDHDSLLEQGIVDSTGVLEVVNFLEQKFGIQFAERDLVPENLDSIASITSYVTRKRSL